MRHMPRWNRIILILLARFLLHDERRRWRSSESAVLPCAWRHCRLGVGAARASALQMFLDSCFEASTSRPPRRMDHLPSCVKCPALGLAKIQGPGWAHHCGESQTIISAHRFWLQARACNQNQPHAIMDTDSPRVRRGRLMPKAATTKTPAHRVAHPSDGETLRGFRRTPARATKPLRPEAF